MKMLEAMEQDLEQCIKFFEIQVNYKKAKIEDYKEDMERRKKYEMDKKQKSSCK